MGKGLEKLRKFLWRLTSITIKIHSRVSFLFGAEQIFNEESVGFTNRNGLVCILNWVCGHSKLFDMYQSFTGKNLGIISFLLLWYSPKSRGGILRLQRTVNVSRQQFESPKKT